MERHFMKPSDFEVGENVTYVPLHAFGDLSHKDCESGQVSSTNEYYVFVKFNSQASCGLACDPADLVKG